MTPEPSTLTQIQILEGQLIWLRAQSCDFNRFNDTLRKGYAAQADAIRLQLEQLKRKLTP